MQKQPPERILFFRQGIFSHINDRVAGWLGEQFPALELVQVDVLQELIKPRRALVCRAGIAALRTYFGRIAAGRADLRDFFYKTPYLFRSVRRLIAEKYPPSSAAFSIQTQSLYDASIDGMPHFVYTDHTHLANLRYPGATQAQLCSPAWIDLEGSLYRRSRRNLVMSSFVRNSLIEDYGCDPGHIAIVGAAPNLPLPASLPDNAGYSNRTILFVGVEWERKGGPILIEAFRRVLEKIPDARLVIAGCSPAVAMPGVQILGRVPLAEVSNLLLRSSVLALPSWREPQGIISIEALLHRIPVVATRVGGLTETVEDGKTGRLVDPGDVPALADALTGLLSNPALCRAYGETGRELAMENYSWPVISRRMGDAIRDGLAES